MSEIYDIGDVVRCSVNVKNLADADVDPTTIHFKIKSPSGVITQYQYGTDAELERDSSGNYHVDFNPDEKGDWRYRFWSTGTAQGAVEGMFEIKQSYFQ